MDRWTHRAPRLRRHATGRLGYCQRMKWWEETVHVLVVMHGWKQQKQLEEAIRDLVWLMVERAEFEGCQHWYGDGKRRAVN
jgi:hypothetical protein